MSITGNLLLFIGIAVFLTGYWFMGKSQGEFECNPPAGKAETNKGGGIAGLVIGSVFMLFGMFVNFTTPAAMPPMGYAEY
jgi:ABC-type phosphate transport system permease subunit